MCATMPQTVESDRCWLAAWGPQLRRVYGGAYLVYEVDFGMGRQVAQQVHGAVQVVHGGHLAPHTVVEPPGAVVVDEAVPHPQTWDTSASLVRQQRCHPKCHALLEV